MDLRKPTGWFFLMYGVILLVLGVVDPSLKAPLTTANVNLYAGAAMAVFGGVMLWLTRLHS
jgi:hypothetical protein